MRRQDEMRMRCSMLLLLLACVIARDPVAAAATVDVSVDVTIAHQVMQGFGSGHQPRAFPDRGDILTPSQRTRAIDAVYRQVGLTTGYLDTALLESPGSYDARRNDNSDPLVIAWSGFQTFRADSVKTLVVDRAQPLGFTDYALAERVNVRWASPWLANIRAADRSRYLDEAAEQVAAGYIYWRDTYGIVPALNMLFNEPLSGNGELSSGSKREVADLIARIGARLRSEGFAAARFLVPNEETVGRTVDTAGTILADATARPYVGAIGYHPYPYGSAYASISQILATSGAGQPVVAEVAVRNQLRDLAGQYGLPVWMTEISHGGVDPRSFAALRGRAIHIHDELVYADASAYLAYGNMWDRVSQQEHFGNANLFSGSNEGFIAFIDQDADTVTISGLGYAIGHYARWIKQGARRIDAASSDPLVQVTAFRDDGQNRLVLVLINNAPEQRAVRIALTGAHLGGAITGEQSTANAVWQALSPIAPSEALAASGQPANATTPMVTDGSIRMTSTRSSLSCSLETFQPLRMAAPQPLVSIIVPVFNGERYLRESLDSILAQTYARTEVLVMDDASTDQTAAIIAEYGDRLRCHRQPTNRGIYGNANDGIALARGEYIAVYHADDIYDPDIVAREVAFLQRHPDAGAVFCKDIVIDALGREIGRVLLPPELPPGVPLDYATLFNALLTHKNRFLCCPTAMVRAAVYREVGGYRDVEFRNSADLEMWLRIARTHRIGLLDEYLLRYRRGHGGSAQRYHHLRTEPERYFRIMDTDLREAGAAVATPTALAAHEAHRAEDAVICAMHAYVRGERVTAQRLLASVRTARLLGSAQVQRFRLVILLYGLRLAARLPRIALLADLLLRRREAGQRAALAAASAARR